MRQHKCSIYINWVVLHYRLVPKAINNTSLTVHYSQNSKLVFMCVATNWIQYKLDTCCLRCVTTECHIQRMEAKDIFCLWTGCLITIFSNQSLDLLLGTCFIEFSAIENTKYVSLLVHTHRSVTTMPCSFKMGIVVNSLLLSSFFHKVRDSENTSTSTVNCNNRD